MSAPMQLEPWTVVGPGHPTGSSPYPCLGGGGGCHYPRGLNGSLSPLGMNPCCEDPEEGALVPSVGIWVVLTFIVK